MDKRYFREVDSLRALAVAAVILNHTHEKILGGGFLGVDIFFVISGFVVTASLVQGSPKASLFSFLKGFYTRRLKRLYPALLSCVALFTLLCFVFFPSPLVYIKTAFWATLGMSNMYLLHQESDYFAVSSKVNPFTHTWSLGVEEQFYLIFPLLFYFFRTKLARILPLLTLVSLALFWYLKTQNSSQAFYLMPTRLWQFALGAFIFISPATSRLSKMPKNFILAPLLLLIGVMIFTDSFRIGSTLAITVLTAFSLALIKESKEERAYLVSPPLLKMGMGSYSLYLFHWPVLIFFKQTISLQGFRAAIALTLIVTLSALSYRYVESNLRRASWNRMIRYGLLTAFAYVFFSQSLPNQMQHLFLGTPKEPYISRDSSIVSLVNSCTEGSISKTFPKVATEMQERLRGCHIHKVNPEAPSLYLFGNSHMEEKAHSFILLAEENQWNLYYYAMSGISIIGEELVASPNFGKKTSKIVTNIFFEAVYPLLRPGDILVVSTPLHHFLSSRRFLDSQGHPLSGDEAFSSFMKFIEDKTKILKNKGIKLLLVAGYPVLTDGILPESCYQPWSHLNPACQIESVIDHDSTERIRKMDAKLRSNTNIQYISLFEPVESALRQHKNPLNMYYSSNHLSGLANTEWIYPYLKQLDIFGKTVLGGR